MTDRQKAFVSIIAVVFIGGATSAIAKIGLSQVTPISFAFLRFLLAAIVVSPYLFHRKKEIVRHRKELFFVSIFATFNVLFFTLGLKTTTATISSLLYAGTPLLTGIIGYLVLHERLTRAKISGMIIGFIGVLLVVFLPVIESQQKFSGDLTGNLLIIFAVMCWSFYMVFSKKAQRHHSPFFLTSVFILITTVLLFPLFVIDITTNLSWIQNIRFSGILAITYVAIITTVISYLFNQYAIKHGGAVFASMTFYLQPPIAYIAAFFLLGEQLTSGLLLGGVLSILGVYLVTKRNQSRNS